METLDIDWKEISFIRYLYWNQKAYIRTEYRLSQENRIKRGVRQGCVLSPCLCNLYTENIFSAINEDLQEILNEVNRIGKTFYMKMNAKRTIRTWDKLCHQMENVMMKS